MLDDNFHMAWQHIVKYANPDDFDSTLLQTYWKTLKGVDLNFEMLIANMLNMSNNPFVAMLTVYLYGVAQGLDGVLEESILLREHSHTPEWLDKIILENLKKTYEHRH